MVVVAVAFTSGFVFIDHVSQADFLLDTFLLLFLGGKQLVGLGLFRVTFLLSDGP